MGKGISTHAISQCAMEGNTEQIWREGAWRGEGEKIPSYKEKSWHWQDVHLSTALNIILTHLSAQLLCPPRWHEKTKLENMKSSKALNIPPLKTLCTSMGDLCFLHHPTRRVFILFSAFPLYLELTTCTKICSERWPPQRLSEFYLWLGAPNLVLALSQPIHNLEEAKVIAIHAYCSSNFRMINLVYHFGFHLVGRKRIQKEGHKPQQDLMKHSLNLDKQR